MHHLIGQGAGAGDNTYGTVWLMYESRHDADLALAGRYDPGQLGPISLTFFPADNS